MADIQISVDAGTQTRLLTAQKYCPSDILVIATEGEKTNNYSDIITGNTTDFYDTYANLLVNDCFRGNFTIMGASLYKVESCGINIFRNSGVNTEYFPLLQAITSGFNYSSNQLKWAYFGAATSIASDSFVFSAKFVALILAGNQLVTLESSEAFNGTPIASGTGYIYVPDNLVEQYKVATNWATYASQIKGLSELPAEVQEWLDQMEAAA